jgi:hypothetical protein
MPRLMAQGRAGDLVGSALPVGGLPFLVDPSIHYAKLVYGSHLETSRSG